MGIKQNNVYLVWIHSDPETYWVERAYLNKKRALRFAKDLAARDNLIEREADDELEADELVIGKSLVRYSNESYTRWVTAEAFPISGLE